MATALRPQLTASAIRSRYGSHALALGARVGAVTAESVATCAATIRSAGESS